MVKTIVRLLAAPLLLPAASAVCLSPDRVFHVRIDIFSSELGYYTFEECGDVTNPVLGIELGETYTFIQADRSNYYHPMGFSYISDGAHIGAPELNPGVSMGNSDCSVTKSCPAPQYFRGDERGDEPLAGKDNGLSIYKKHFSQHLSDWATYSFSIQLKYDDSTYTRDLFYFCLIHSEMAGRIKLLRNGVPIQTDNVPVLSFKYDEPSDFDKVCGTFGLNDSQLPNPHCPDRFICGTDLVSDELQRFSACLEAANCKMLTGMTTGIKATEDTALFIHQMIPHHQNAVNTAKTLLKTGSLLCPDLMDQENPNCLLESILRDIVASQNHQIQLMRKYLDANRFPKEDNCEVFVKTVSESSFELISGETKPTSRSTNKSASIGWTTMALVLSIMVVFT